MFDVEMILFLFFTVFKWSSKPDCALIGPFAETLGNCNVLLIKRESYKSVMLLANH